MDYGSILSNAWDTIWRKKFLFIVGILSVLGANAGLSGLNYIANPSQLTQSLEIYGKMGYGPSYGPEQLQTIRLATIIVGVVMMVLGVVLWFNSRISIGGLIAGVGKLGESELRGFKSAWIAGWERRWPMFGLGLLTLLPIWIITVPTYLINKNLQQQQMEIIANPSLYDLGPDYFYPYLGLCGVICAMLVIILPLYLFQVLADRACMLEALTFSEAVGRAWQVVRQKAGQMIVLFLIQIGIALGIGLVAGVFVCMLSCGLGALASMMSPMLSMAVSYVLMPFMFVFSGIIQTYFSAVWTIAWLDWANDVLAHNIKVETPVTSG